MEIAGSWGQPKALADSRVRLYVDPCSGLLRVNRARAGGRQARAGKAAREAARPAERRRILGPLEQLHWIDGVWYRVTLAVLPEVQRRVTTVRGVARENKIAEARWDVLGNAYVARGQGRSGPGPRPVNEELYGRTDVYALAKRQLNRQELKRYGLTGSGIRE